MRVDINTHTCFSTFSCLGFLLLTAVLNRYGVMLCST